MIEPNTSLRGVTWRNQDQRCALTGSRLSEGQALLLLDGTIPRVMSVWASVHMDVEAALAVHASGLMELCMWSPTRSGQSLPQLSHHQALHSLIPSMLLAWAWGQTVGEGPLPQEVLDILAWANELPLWQGKQLPQGADSFLVARPRNLSQCFGSRSNQIQDPALSLAEIRTADARLPTPALEKALAWVIEVDPTPRLLKPSRGLEDIISRTPLEPSDLPFSPLFRPFSKTETVADLFLEIEESETHAWTETDVLELESGEHWLQGEACIQDLEEALLRRASEPQVCAYMATLSMFLAEGVGKPLPRMLQAWRGIHCTPYDSTPLQGILGILEAFFEEARQDPRRRFPARIHAQES